VPTATLGKRGCPDARSHRRRVDSIARTNNGLKGKKTTHDGKVNRERRLRERRIDKQAKKDAGSWPLRTR